MKLHSLANNFFQKLYNKIWFSTCSLRPSEAKRKSHTKCSIFHQREKCKPQNFTSLGTVNRCDPAKKNVVDCIFFAYLYFFSRSRKTQQPSENLTFRQSVSVNFSLHPRCKPVS